MSSWLSGLAGKAEDFLNTLDTSAASALNKSAHGGLESDSQHPPSLLPPPPLMVEPPTRHSPLGRSPSQASLGSAARATQPPIHQQSLSSSAIAPSSKRVDKDAELMELLNSETPLDSLVGRQGSNTSGSMLSSTPTPTSASAAAATDAMPSKISAQHSRQSSVASSFSKYSASEIKAEMANAAAAAATSGSSTIAASASVTSAPASSASVFGVTEDNPPAEIENKLLRSEISSLNQELSSLLKRNQSAQDAAKRLEAELAKCRQQLKQAEEAAASGQAREQQLSDLLHSRDARIAEMASGYDSLRDQLELVRADSSRSAGFQQAAFDELNERLRQAEARLEQEKAGTASLQAELRRMRQDAEQQQAVSAQAGRALAEEQRRLRAQGLELEAAQRRCQQAQSELRDYKEKAGRILQVKDKMIAALKKGGNGGGSSGELGGIPDAADAAVGSSAAELFAEVEALRQERELLREEAQRAKLAAEGLRCDVEDLEAQMQSESETFRKTMSGLEAQLESERLARLSAEEEAHAARRDSGQQRDLWLRDKAELSQRLAQSEAEIEALRRQTTGSHLLRSGGGTAASSQEGSELEARIRSLTDSLIQKQTALESSNTEKASLRLMVEQLESRLSERAHHAASMAQESGSLMSSRSQAPQSDYIRIHMQDPPYARHMKRAVNTLDKAGVKLGVFLRRYPMARMLFLAYIGLLHLWVLLVLLTYQPEMHHQGFNGGAMPQPPGLAGGAASAGGPASNPS